MTPAKSVRPRVPLPAKRLHVIIDLDLFQAIDAFFRVFGRIFSFPSNRLEEWPEERERQPAKVHVTDGRFYFRFRPIFARVANCNADSEAENECADHGWHRIFAQEKFRALARRRSRLFRLLPGATSRLRDPAGRLTPTALRRSLYSALHRILRRVPKLVAVWINHNRTYSELGGCLRLSPVAAVFDRRRNNAQEPAVSRRHATSPPLVLRVFARELFF